MEENFNIEWKKIASMAYGKIVFDFIPYHAISHTGMPSRFKF